MPQPTPRPRPTVAPSDSALPPGAAASPDDPAPADPAAAPVPADADLVRALLAAQHPDLADRALHAPTRGWDNVTWRLGDDLAVRLPARAEAAGLVENEQRWLPVLADRLPVPVPAPVRVGLPGDGYPWRWSVVPWLPGQVVAATAPADRTAWAADLAEALAALHVPAPADAPRNPVRGVPLVNRDGAVRARLTAPDGLVAALAERPALIAAWEAGLAAPVWDGPAVWLHGDPHPANLVARAGRLAGLIDFGDLGAGDPATDLATAWLTFDADGRRAFRARTDALRGWDDATWVRARAWAASMVGLLLAHPDEHPLLAVAGRHAAAQVAAG